MELVPVSRSQTALNPLDNEGQITENEDEEAEALLEAIDGTLCSARLGARDRDRSSHSLSIAHSYKLHSSVASAEERNESVLRILYYEFNSQCTRLRSRLDSTRCSLLLRTCVHVLHAYEYD